MSACPNHYSYECTCIGIWAEMLTCQQTQLSMFGTACSSKSHVMVTWKRVFLSLFNISFTSLYKSLDGISQKLSFIHFLNFLQDEILLSLCEHVFYAGAFQRRLHIACEFSVIFIFLPGVPESKSGAFQFSFCSFFSCMGSWECRCLERSHIIAWLTTRNQGEFSLCRHDVGLLFQCMDINVVSISGCEMDSMN